MHQNFSHKKQSTHQQNSIFIFNLSIIIIITKNIKEKLKEIVKLFYHHTKHEGFYLTYFRSATEWLHASIVMFMTLFLRELQIVIKAGK